MSSALTIHEYMQSEFIPPIWWRSSYLSTIWPSLLRNEPIDYRRERLDLWDGDFVDLDFAGSEQSKNCVLLLHGLEGSSRSNYLVGMANTLLENQYRVCSMNFRGCSGEPNKFLACYHSGKSDDLKFVIDHLLNVLPQEKITVIGFSVGGNILLKLLGEDPEWSKSAISSAVSICAPCDLAGCAAEMAQPKNKIYMKRFLVLLRQKLEIKNAMFPGQLSLKRFGSLKNFYDFDQRYTAPLHGYSGAEHYWRENSSLEVLNNICVPCLMLSPQNDPFLSKSSYPESPTTINPHLSFEFPRFGGHCGFVQHWRTRQFYSEHRVLRWLAEKNVSQ